MTGKIKIDDKTLIMYYQNQIICRKKVKISKQWLVGLQKIFKASANCYDVPESTISYIEQMISDALAEEEPVN